MWRITKLTDRNIERHVPKGQTKLQIRTLEQNCLPVYSKCFFTELLFVSMCIDIPLNKALEHLTCSLYIHYSNYLLAYIFKLPAAEASSSRLQKEKRKQTVLEGNDLSTKLMLRSPEEFDHTHKIKFCACPRCNARK